MLREIKTLQEKSKIEGLNRLEKLQTIEKEAISAWVHGNGNLQAEPPLQLLMEQVKSTNNVAREISFLHSLRFQTMTHRHCKIPDAQSKTFEWVFKTFLLARDDVRSLIRLSTWFKSKDGIFWVSGKPGSGKSTFMKWVSDYPTTYELLRKWAAMGQSQLITASFYFWNAGTDMEKSQQGLLQSMLHEILSKRPELIPKLCPERWSQQDTPYLSEQWKRPELIKAFKLLRDESPKNMMFCVFIDGLDEYDGDYYELLDIIISMARCPHIKLCVSSRSWNCFESALGKDNTRKLYLQDLTRDDIKIYVSHKLSAALSSDAAKNESLHCERLITEVVDRAQGVFLWVYLVVRSLQEGLSNGDSLNTLRQRLSHLPSDLESFFNHILFSVDEVYQEKMAYMLYVSLETRDVLYLMAYSFLNEDDPDFAIKLAKGEMAQNEMEYRIKTTRRILNGWTKGLLEAIRFQNGQGKAPNTGYFELGVDFLHRTVRDFLRTKDMQSKLQGMVNCKYNASFAISRALLAILKTVPTHSGYNIRDKLMFNITDYIRKAERFDNSPDSPMLEEY
jgi:NACHT domain-containing protein